MPLALVEQRDGAAAKVADGDVVHEQPYHYKARERVQPHLRVCLGRPSAVRVASAHCVGRLSAACWLVATAASVATERSEPLRSAA